MFRKEKYETPKMEITRFDVEDVITTSGDPVSPPSEGPDWETEMDPNGLI